MGAIGTQRDGDFVCCRNKETWTCSSLIKERALDEEPGVLACKKKKKKALLSLPGLPLPSFTCPGAPGVGFSSLLFAWTPAWNLELKQRSEWEPTISLSMSDVDSQFQQNTRLC